MPSKSNDGKRKNNDRNHHNSNRGRSSTCQGNTSRGGRGGRGRGRGGRGGRGNNSEHLKMLNVLLVPKRVTIPLTSHSQEKMTMKTKHGFQIVFQKPIPILIEGNVDQKGQTRKEKR
jgi:hypothetical protein